jgi:hypothetical protein
MWFWRENGMVNVWGSLSQILVSRSSTTTFAGGLPFFQLLSRGASRRSLSLCPVSKVAAFKEFRCLCIRCNLDGAQGVVTGSEVPATASGTMRRFFDVLARMVNLDADTQDRAWNIMEILEKTYRVYSQDPAVRAACEPWTNGLLWAVPYRLQRLPVVTGSEKILVPVCCRCNIHCFCYCACLEWRVGHANPQGLRSQVRAIHELTFPHTFHEQAVPVSQRIQRFCVLYDD